MRLAPPADLVIIHHVSLANILNINIFASLDFINNFHRQPNMQEPHQASPDKTDGAIPDAPVFTPPEYTMKDIHDAIPAHCFQPSSLLSIAYVVLDFFFVSTLALLAWTTIPYLPNSLSRNLAWIAYSFTQGLFFTGLWELAHECGHGALSKKKWVNDVLGLIIHSFLFVPFHSWRITHAFHHKVTNNIEKDIAFVPDVREDWVAKRDSRSEFIAKAIDLVEDVPICVLAELIGHQLIAWPTYLIINNFALARMAIVPWWKRSHFYFGGDGPNFKPMHKRDIIVSDIGIALSALLLWVAVHFFGGWNVMKVYGFPYLWTNHWIRQFYAPSTILASPHPFLSQCIHFQL